MMSIFVMVSVFVPYIFGFNFVSYIFPASFRLVISGGYVLASLPVFLDLLDSFSHVQSVFFCRYGRNVQQPCLYI